MARIRTIKPEFWSDEKVVECSVNARLLFIGLWNFADDAGRQEDAPRQIKMKVFPGDDVTADQIDGMLQELSRNGLLIRYIVDGKRYLQIKGWRHQLINKPQKPRNPPPPDSEEINSGNGTGKVPVGMEGKGKEKEGKESSPKPPSETVLDEWTGLTDEIWQFANLRPDAYRAAGKVDDFRLVKIWRELGATPDQIRSACKTVIDRAGEIRSLWKLLASAVPEELEKLRTEAATPPSDGIDPRWRLRVGSWVKSGGKSWSPSIWGEPPDHPRSDVPAVVLAEFKITPKLEDDDE